MAGWETSVGLDLGRHSVKAVWVRRSGEKMRVIRAETLRLPHDSLDILGVLHPWIGQQGLVRASCVVGIQGQQTMFQPLTFPTDDPRSLDQAAGIEVVKFNEIAQENMGYSFSPFALKPEERRVLLAMARPSVVDGVMDLSRKAGVQVVDIVPAPVACFNALAHKVSAESGPVILANVGHSATEVAIGFGKGLMFARSFPCAWLMFTDAIAKAMKLSRVHAETLKHKEGSLLPGSSVEKALNSVADTWVSEMQSLLSVYGSAIAGGNLRPRRMLLCGGGSQLKGFAEYAGRRLEMEVSLVSELFDRADAKLENPGVFVVGAGLAVSGFEAAPAKISLLPQGVRDELTFRRQKPFWVAATITAGAILGLSLWAGSADFRRSEKALTEEMQLRNRQTDMMAQTEGIKAGTGRMRRMAAPVRQLVRTGPLVRDLITVVGNAKAQDDWVTLICDAESYSVRRTQASQGRAGARDRRREAVVAVKNSARSGFEHVILEGYTPVQNLATVRKLIEELKAAPFVRSADLLGDDSAAAPAHAPKSGAARRFVIDVELGSR